MPARCRPASAVEPARQFTAATLAGFDGQTYRKFVLKREFSIKSVVALFRIAFVAATRPPGGRAAIPLRVRHVAATCSPALRTA
jgi:hypothetical protein